MGAERLDGLAVICRAGSFVFGLPVEHVSETMRPLPVEPLSGMPSYIAGLSIVRGVPMPVVDAARMLGEAGPRPSGRFVAIRTGSRRAVIAVDDVLGVRSVARGSLHDLPALLGDASAEVIASMGTLDAGLLLVLRSARLVPASVWATLDAGGAS